MNLFGPSFCVITFFQEIWLYFSWNKPNLQKTSSAFFMLGVKFTGLFLVPLKIPHSIIPHCQIMISVSLTWNDVSNIEQKTGW